MTRRAFTLIELLVVIAVIAVLLAIVAPALRQARLQAKIVAVNSDLRQIGLALEMYFLDHKKYPPTREDCNWGSISNHLYQLPHELAEGTYLPATSRLEAMSTTIEDRFNPGHTYKYRSVGECIIDRNRIDRWSRAQLWVPAGFPGTSSLNDGKLYDTPDESPVQWTLFCLGPDFDEAWLRTFENKYPVPHETWYHPERKRGLLVRLRLKHGGEIGAFLGNP